MAWIPAADSGGGGGDTLPAPVPLAFANPLAPPGGASEVIYDVTATSDFTLNAPSTPDNGHRVVLNILSSGGAWNITLGAGIALPSLSSQTSPLALVSGKVSILKMLYSTLTSKWHVVAFVGGY
jgi:hypothetical protein